MDVYGSLVSPWQVEQATLKVLASWMPWYLYEIERAGGLAQGTIPQPPAPDSYFGGLDFGGWQQDQCPAVIVVVDPVGEPERTGEGNYGQDYEIQVGGVVIGSDEDQARQYANHYATAIMGSIIQGDPSLGGLATRTTMVGSPKPAFQNPDEQLLVQAHCVFHSFVVPIINEDAGLNNVDPTASPVTGGKPQNPPGAWPTVVHVTTSLHGTN